MNIIFFTFIGIIALSFIYLQSIVESIYGDHDNDRLFAGNTFVESHIIVTADITDKRLATGLAIGFYGISFTSITCTHSQTKCYGSMGNDRMTGDYGGNEMHGYSGNDLMYGNENVDVMIGYEGDDEIYGGGGTDKIVGDEGADRIFGEKEMMVSGMVRIHNQMAQEIL